MWVHHQESEHTKLPIFSEKFDFFTQICQLWSSISQKLSIKSNFWVIRFLKFFQFLWIYDFFTCFMHPVQMYCFYPLIHKNKPGGGYSALGLGGATNNWSYENYSSFHLVTKSYSIKYVIRKRIIYSFNVCYFPGGMSNHAFLNGTNFLDVTSVRFFVTVGRGNTGMGKVAPLLEHSSQWLSEWSDGMGKVAPLLAHSLNGCLKGRITYNGTGFPVLGHSSQVLSERSELMGKVVLRLEKSSQWLSEVHLNGTVCSTLGTNFIMVVLDA